MKKYLLILFVLFIGCSSKTDYQYPFKAPSTRVVMLDGRYLTVDSFRRNGEELLVLFWAQHCNKSRGVMTKLNEIAPKLRQKKAIRFLAVSLDKESDIEKVKSFITNKDIKFVEVAASGNKDSDEAMFAYRVKEIPQFFLIGADGQVKLGGSSSGELDDLLD